MKKSLLFLFAALILGVDSASALEIRVNVGGNEYTDGSGNLWSADTGYNTGYAASDTARSVSATTEDTLYQFQRWDDGAAPELIYSFSVPNGEYTVQLHFAEMYNGAFSVGARVFDVYVEDQLQLDDFDIFAAVGRRTALIQSLSSIIVNDGQLNIEFSHQVENPTLAAIEIISVAPPVEDTTPPTEPQDLVATTVSSNQVALSWAASIDTETGVAGYRLYRDGVALATTTATDFVDDSVNPQSYYVYAVAAFDYAEPANESVASTLEVTTPQASQSGETVLYRVNLGGNDYTDSQGNQWSADFGYNTGYAANDTARAVASTDDDTLYQYQRWDHSPEPELIYGFSVPNGDYQVRLHFAEMYSGAFSPGARVFDVYVEDQLRIDNLDVFAAVGRRTALVETISGVSVSDGELTIMLGHQTENPTMAAIEIVQTAAPGPDFTAPTQPQNLVADSVTSSQAVLSWTAASDTESGVAGYDVYRDGVQLATVSATDFADSGLAAASVYTYEVVAVDNAGNQSVAASLNVTTADAEAPVGDGVLYRINVGGGDYTDGSGNLWSADAGYNTGYAASTTNGVSGTADDTLFQYQRWDDGSNPELTYSLAVPDGNYEVVLYFAEMYSGAFSNGARVFDIYVEDQLRIDNLDIFASAGQRAALAQTISSVTVTDGQLNIMLGHQVENPSLAAIEVKTMGTSNPVTLPVDYDFSSADLSDWLFVADSGASADWSQIDGKLVQSLDAGSKYTGDPYLGSYKLGTFAVLNGLTGLTDYHASVEITPRRDQQILWPSFDGQDIGVMFRYQDASNYYRISFSGKASFARLEKRVNGVFSTLATIARGYVEDQTYNLDIRLQGPLISVELDGEPLFAAYDTDLTRGSVALYCQDGVEFDNLSISELSVEPMIRAAGPYAYSVQADNNITASALVFNKPAGSYVEFDFAGLFCGAGVESPVGSGFYSADCGSFPQGEYNQPGQALNAYLYSATDVLVNSAENLPVGIGDQYIAVGDSITEGVFDFYEADNQSADGRVVGKQGMASYLGDLLTESTGYPNLVFNNGVGGDRTVETLNRIDSILERHSTANRVLMMIGTNDAGGSSNPTVNNYRNRVQQLVDKATGQGKALWLAKMPPSVPAADYPSTNDLKRQYNGALDAVAGALPGPDFYRFFYDDNGTATAADDYERTSLFYDSIHPNSVGLRVMAVLWNNAITGTAVAPFFLDLLCNRLVSATCDDVTRTQHKQTYLATVNSVYYIDEDYEVLSAPAILDGGIWIQTANAEANGAVANYLEFSVDRAVEVFVAFDDSATGLPAWLAADYMDTGTVVETTDPQSPLLRVYSRTYAAGTVSLGSNVAPGVDSNYVVIVKEI